MSSQQHVGGLKFSALKVDVTSLARGPIVVVVVSNVTKSRDMVKSVVQKLGLSRDQVPLMELVAVVSCKPRPHEVHADYGDGGTEIVLRDDESPLSIYHEHPKNCVRFSLQWKRIDDVVTNGRSDRRPSAVTITTASIRSCSPAVSDDSPAYCSALPSNPPMTSSRVPAVTSHAPLSWQRRCAETSAGDCLIEYDGSGLAERVEERLRNSSGSTWSDIRHHGRLHDPRRIIGNSHKVPESKRLQHDPLEFRHSSGLDGGRRRVDRLIGRCDDLHRPHSNLAAGGGCSDVSDSTSRDHSAGRATSASVGSRDSVHRPLVKFLSLPDVDRILRQSSTGSDVNDELWDWDSVSESARCLDRSSTFVSMPCIASRRRRRGAGRGLTPKRFLPVLSIPQEAVEAKRKSMSALVLARLQKVSGKRRHSKSSKCEHRKQTAASSTSTNQSRHEARHHTATTAAGAVAIDDDCMSVTSREVAAILSTAGPLAPPSDDDDDDKYSGYDVTELEQFQQLQPQQQQQHQYGSLSSAIQLLRVSSTSSLSPSNTSTETSLGPATPPPPRNRAVHQSHVSQLNNGRSDRGAAEFRPTLNGACVTPVNGDDHRAGVDRQLNGGGPRALCRPGTSERLALFDLLTSHRLFVLTLDVRPNNGHHIRGPPFQVINEEIYIPADNSHRLNASRVSVPVVSTLAAKYRNDWRLTSSENIRPGDIIVEVNGVNVLSEAAVSVLDLVVSSSYLDIVVARQRSLPPMTSLH